MRIHMIGERRRERGHQKILYNSNYRVGNSTVIQFWESAKLISFPLFFYFIPLYCYRLSKDKNLIITIKRKTSLRSPIVWSFGKFWITPTHRFSLGLPALPTRYGNITIDDLLPIFFRVIIKNSVEFINKWQKNYISFILLKKKKKCFIDTFRLP